VAAAEEDMPINMIVTEPQASHFEAIFQRYALFFLLLLAAIFCRLVEIYGQHAQLRSSKELMYPKYMKLWEELKTGITTVESTAPSVDPPTRRRLLLNTLNKAAPTLSQEKKDRVINLVLSASPATDHQVATLTDTELDPLAEGLELRLVKVGPMVYRLPTTTWQAVERELEEKEGA
jgi:hypothetical protein